MERKDEKKSTKRKRVFKKNKQIFEEKENVPQAPSNNKSRCIHRASKTFSCP